MGAPLYTPEIFEQICHAVGEGETLTSVCRRLDIGTSTVYDWINREDLSGQFAQARARGFDAIADECVQIAENGTKDYIRTDGGLMFDREHVQRSKLRIETRLKLLAKWDPKRYGDRLELAGDKNAPLKVEIVQFTPIEGESK